MIKTRPFSLLSVILRSIISQLIISEKLVRRVSLLSIYVFTIVNSYTCYSQDSYRRHFIIAYDISEDFMASEDRIPDYQLAVEDLFDNKRVINYSGGYSNIISLESNNNKQFFEPDKDEISFFHFNISQNEIAGLQRSVVIDNKLFTKSFTDAFLKNTNITWSGFAKVKDNKPEIRDFIINIFNTVPSNPSDNTFSAAVYPLILDKISSEKPAEEYILIILSPQTPTVFTSTDLSFIKSKILGTPLSISVSDGSVGYLKNHLDSLLLQYDETVYFNYNFKLDGQRNASIGIFGYFITPHNVKPASAATAVTISSDIKFMQKSYRSTDFISTPIKIRFPENEFLKPYEVNLTIISGDNEIFKDVIASQISEDEWSSEYLNSNNIITRLFHKLMKFNESRSSYSIPKLRINLESLNNYRNFDSIRLKFDLKSQIKGLDKNFLNYKFYGEIGIPETNITYKRNVTLIFILVFFIGAIVGIYFLLKKGKPLGIRLSKPQFTDSFETTDYSETGNGRYKTAYREWTDIEENKGRITINVKGQLTYKTKNKFYNWKEKNGYPLQIRPLTEIKTDGLSGFIEYDGRQAGVNDPIIITESYGFDQKTQNYKEFEFRVVLFKKDNFKINKPIHINFTIEVCAKINHLLYRSLSLQTQLPFEFHIGPKLGNVWVGIDPGTTGSCIATATCSDDITIEQIDGHDKISPSVINIDTSKLSMANLSYETLQAASESGARADARQETETRKKFISLKKLIGFRDVFILKEFQGQKITITSTQLSSLLVEGLLNEHKDYIEKNLKNPHCKAFCSDSGIYLPKRLAVAIPNNFTSTKIQHLKESIEGIPNYKFDEIRFIYEAEAILINHLNSKNANIDAQESNDGEIVFVFDMGGATINATLARIKKGIQFGDIVYDLEIIGKLGYGIGGDTIDYAFIKWLYSVKSNYTSLSTSNPFARNDSAQALRKKLKTAMLGIKKEMITLNENKKAQQILTRSTLENFADLNLKTVLDSEKNVDDRDPFMRFLNKKGDNILTSEIFQELVWDNISKIVEDILLLCARTNLNTVLLCGRSVKFPLVKETVLNTIENKSAFQPKTIEYDLDKAKSAVALGACFYGIQKESIHLKNVFNNAVFGVKQNINPTEFVFHKLIEAGTEFFPGKNGCDNYISKFGLINQEKRFSFDGLRVNFYQIMGVNANEILKRNERHKFTRIASITAHLPIDQINVLVTEKDRVTCSVIDANKEPWFGNATVRDCEITDSNDEHYTFFVK